MYKFRIFTFLLSLFISTSLFAQWQSTAGPAGRINVWETAQHDSLLFGFTHSCGIYVKTGLEKGWQKHSSLKVKQVAIADDTMYVATDSSIKAIDLNDPALPVVHRSQKVISALGARPGYLYAGHKEDGFSYSTDGGVTFLSFNTGLPADTIAVPTVHYKRNVIAIKATSTYIFCATPHGVFRSDLSHTSWVGKNNGLNPQPYSITLIKEINGELYAASRTSLFKSVNNGDHWMLLTSNFQGISGIEMHDDTLYMSSQSGVHKSYRGISWVPWNTGLRYLHIRGLLAYDNRLFTGSLYGEGFYSFKNGSWERDDQGLQCANVQALVHIDKSLFAGSGRIHRKDSSAAWSNVTPINTDDFSSLTTHGDTVFAQPTIISPINQSRVIYTTDKGLTWQSFANAIPYNSPMLGIFHDGDGLYAWTYKKLFYTNDLGQNWTDMQVPSGACLNNVNWLVKRNSILFVRSCDDQVIKYENNTWQPSNVGLAPGDVEAVAQNENSMFAYVQGSGMYKSADNGQSWQLSNTGLATNLDFNGFTYVGDTAFLISTNGLVYATFDDGNNWGLLLQNPQLFIRSLDIIGDTLYGGTLGEGVWKQAIADMTISLQEQKRRGDQINIYPNPAGNYFIVQTENAKAGDIQVMDITGKVLLQQPFISGERILVNSLPSGTYILKVCGSKDEQHSRLIIGR